MQPPNPTSRQVGAKAPAPGQVTRPLRPSSIRVSLLVLALATLACAFSRLPSASKPNLVATRTPWPTFTPGAAPLSLAQPTPVLAAPTSRALAAPPPEAPTLPAASTAPTDPTPTLTPAPAPAPGEPAASGVTTATPVPAAPAATLVPSPTSVPSGTPASPAPATPIPAASGWSFQAIRVDTQGYQGGLLVYGDLVNQTGSSQELFLITGAFYDAAGQVIADQASAYGYTPVYVIPAGGRVPFELTVEGIQAAADFDLRVEAQPSSTSPRQDFEFADLYQLDEGYGYCIGGRLRNPGPQVQEYVVIVATLYDAQEQVISFGDYYVDPADVVGDQGGDFEICVDPLDQAVARYELRAWGQ